MDEEPEEAVDPRDQARYVLSNVLLLTFVIAASIGGFIIGPQVGMYSLAGSCLVAALLLGNA